MLDDKYFIYANKVLNGEIVAGNFIKLACKRYLSFFKNPDYEFRPEKCERVIRFMSKLKHYSGKTAGKLFKLELWQEWVIYATFGFYYKGTNERVTKKILLTIARKNGKSFFVAAISLYMLLADGEPAAQILNVANNTKQAHLLFEMQQNMLRSVDPKHKYSVITRDMIKIPKTHSYAQVLSSDSSGLDGSSPTTYILDETHEMRDSKLWDVMVSGTGFRESPLGINISTSGFNLTGFLYKYREMCIDVLNGSKTDDSQFIAIYELDEGDDWTDPKNFIKANPNLDVTVTSKYLLEQILNAKNNPALETSVKTKNFNMWVQSYDVWIPNDLLKNNQRNLVYLILRTNTKMKC